MQKVIQSPISIFFTFRPENVSLKLSDACDEDLKARMIKKKKKSLGGINLTVTIDPMTKEEMNEVRFPWDDCFFKK